METLSKKREQLNEYYSKDYQYWETDVKEKMNEYKAALLNNSSEKRKIIEVDKAIAILNEILGDKLR